MIDHEGNEWLRPAEAAERFGVSRNTIDQWVKRNKVTSRKVGRFRWVIAIDVAVCERAMRYAELASPRGKSDT